MRPTASSGTLGRTATRGSALGPDGDAAAGDIRQQPGGKQDDNERRAAVRDKRQRDAGDRQQAGHGANIDNRLRQEPRRYARGHEALERGRGAPGHLRAHDPDGRKQAQDEQAADKPGLLADNRKYEVRVRLGR